jgi:hypothetical protein
MNALSAAEGTDQEQTKRKTLRVFFLWLLATAQKLNDGEQHEIQTS